MASTAETLSIPPETTSDPRDPPGFPGPRLLRRLLDMADFFLVNGWEGYFARRREAHGSTVFRIGLTQPAIAVLDRQGIAALFADPDLKQDYGFGSAVPPRPLVGNVVPSVFEAGARHDAPKRLYQRLLRWRAATLEPVFAETFSEFAEGWTATRGFSWRDEIEDLAATFVFRWLLGTAPDPADVRLVYGNIFTQKLTWLTRLFPHSNYSRSLDAYARIVAVVRSAPDFPRIAAMAAEEGLIDQDALAKQLTFLMGMNSFLGMQNLLKSLAGEMSLHPEMREAARDPSLGRLDGFIRETLRLHPPVFFVYGRATRDRVLDSASGRFAIRKGELVMGVIPFAQRDADEVPRPNDFDPDRYRRDSTAARALIWPRGQADAVVRPEDKTCPGKDAAMVAARLFCTALLRDYEWALAERPEWDFRHYSLNVAAPKGAMTVDRFAKVEQSG
jgi:prostaglandin-endoperoxide synthase 2